MKTYVPSWLIDRAISQGIESARHNRKDGEFEYDLKHPLFNPWWEGVVMKSDCPDYSDSRIKRLAKQNMGLR
jgi:hypothetical protein